ncbi:TetR/AcrR family transcriptional regulator [Nocardia sp. NPDC004722]
MTIDDSPQRRPGGRSTRVREAVHAAVLDAIAEHGVDRVGIPDIARRAEVRDSSIYRRWGTRENLILDALLANSERLMPIPDTGTVHGDLTALATELADYLATPLGSSLVRALAYLTDTDAIAEARTTFWSTRFRAAAPIVSRAIARGELRPDTDPRLALELLAAPLHFRATLTREPVTPEFLSRLADSVCRALAVDSADG